MLYTSSSGHNSKNISVRKSAINNSFLIISEFLDSKCGSYQHLKSQIPLKGSVIPEINVPKFVILFNVLFLI